MARPWWSDGVKFECQGSGKCCVSRGEYGFVYLTLEDRRRAARHFGVTTQEFTRKYCKKDRDWFHFKDPDKPCQFLDGKRCSIYPARPAQCRTWPFWPENMSAKSWDKEVVSFCPGVGKGTKVYSAEEIRELLKQDPIHGETE